MTALTSRQRRRPQRPWLGVVFGTLLATAILDCVPDGTTSKTSRRESVVLITIDTVRAERLGAYGGDTAVSSAFDRWASHGALFTQASATAPLTLPSHATLMTGLLPPQHGLRVNGRGHLPATATTLAETFLDAGYRTGAFVSSAVLAPRHKLDRGFEVYDADMTAGGERTADETVRRARAWLDRIGTEPFFLWVHLHDAHAPYRPPEPYRRLFRQQPYDGELAFLDAEMGKLLDELPAARTTESTGRPDTTRWQGVVCIVGDHGEGLGTHGEQQHGLLLYESTLRVPLVLAAPGLASQRVDTPVSTAQIGATLAWLAGLEASMTAEPFLPQHRLRLQLLDTADEHPAPATTEAAIYSESLLGQSDYGWSPLYALRQGRWKIIKGRYVELFDLETNEDEQFDLLASGTRPGGSGSHAAPTAATAALATRLESELDQLAGTAVLGETGEAVAPSTADVERLRSLGYLGGTRQPGGAAPGPDPRQRTAFHDSVVDVLAEYRDGRFDAAGEGLAALLATAPTNPFLLDLAGSVAMARGRPSVAVSRFQQALTTGGERLPLQARLAEALLEAGRPADAELAARAVLEATSAGGAPDGRTVVILCRALAALGRDDEASATARRLGGRLAATDPYRDHVRRLIRGESVALPGGDAESRPAPW